MSYLHERTVLVAGATGLIGSHAVQALLARGARVVATHHRSPPVLQDPRVEHRRVDLTTRAGCETAVAGCQAVLLCAANTSGAYVMRTNPVAHVTENLLINAQVIEAAWRARAERLLFVSTTTVYPGVEHAVREDEGFVDEPHPVYFGVGWMKRYVEKLCEFYRQRLGLGIAIVRPTNVYGPRDKFDPERSHVLPALIRRALEGEDPFVVWGDGSAVRDFVYVDDAVEAMLLALERADGEPINVGSGTSVTIRETVDLLLPLCGRAGAKVVYDPTKPTTIPARRVDISRAKERLGWAPRVGLAEGLRRTIEWYRAQPR